MANPWDQSGEGADPWATDPNAQGGATPWQTEPTPDPNAPPEQTSAAPTTPNTAPPWSPPSTGSTRPAWEANVPTGKYSTQTMDALAKAYQQYLGRDPDAQGFATNIANPRGSVGWMGVLRSSGEAADYRFKTYKSNVDALNTEADPTVRATKADQLARSLYSDLSSDGHQVEWVGKQLKVDGRLYDMAATPAGPTPPPAAAGAAGSPVPKGSTTVGPGGLIPGVAYDRMSSPEYANSYKGRAAILASYINTSDPIKAGQELASKMQAEGYNVSVDAEGNVMLTGDAAGYYGVRNGGWSWMAYNRAHPGPNGEINGEPGQGGASPWHPDLSAIGNQAGAAGGTGGVAAVGSGTDASYHPTAPGYTPGAVPDSGLNWTYDSLMKQLMAGGQIDEANPAAYDFSGFHDLPALYGSSGATDQATEALVNQILAHPESLDATTQAQLKGQQREAIASRAQLDDQNLKALGYSSNLADSPWLAAQRADELQKRNQDVNASNRALDIEAAKTNFADRASTAKLGADYTASRAQRALAERGQVFTEAQQAEVDKQAAVKSGLDVAQYHLQAQTARAQQAQQAVQTAVNASIAKDTNEIDRTKMKESFAQEAAKIGQSADQLQINYIDAMTRKLGVELGYNIDSAKLAEQSSEFKDNLMYLYAKLSQDDAQFGANLGLGYGQLGQQANQLAWEQSKDTYLPPPA